MRFSNTNQRAYIQINIKSSSKGPRGAHLSSKVEKTYPGTAQPVDLASARWLGFCPWAQCGVARQLGDGGHCGWNASSFWTYRNHMAGGWSSKRAKPIRARVGGIHFDTLVSCMGTPPRTKHTAVTLVTTSGARLGWLAWFSCGALIHPQLLGSCYLHSIRLPRSLSSLETWGHPHGSLGGLFYCIEEQTCVCAQTKAPWVFLIVTYTRFSQTDFCLKLHSPDISIMSLNEPTQTLGLSQWTVQLSVSYLTFLNLSSPICKRKHTH